MVRVSSLPFRLLCRHYGADIVYSEEIIAAKLKHAVRSVDNSNNTVVFTVPASSFSSPSPPVFVTYAHEPVVLQLGASTAEDALQAARVVAGDVRGVDLNMGCPVRFSTQGGMGSALLSQPAVVHSILSTLRRELPASVAVTCKVRLLETARETLQLLQAVEAAGVDAVAVHARRVPDKPRHRALLSELQPLLSHLSIPTIVNGDMFTPQDMAAARSSFPSSSLMIARGAQWNPSVFSPRPLPALAVASQYLRTARGVCSHAGNSKYTLMEMLKGQVGAMPVWRRVVQAQGWDELEEALAAVTAEVQDTVVAGERGAAALSAGAALGAGERARADKRRRETQRLRRLLHGEYQPPTVPWEDRPASQLLKAEEERKEAAGSSVSQQSAATVSEQRYQLQCG